MIHHANLLAENSNNTWNGELGYESEVGAPSCHCLTPPRKGDEMVAGWRRVDQCSSGLSGWKVHKCQKRALLMNYFLLSLISAVTEAIHWPVGVNYKL
jgi:hypothetical protein